MEFAIEREFPGRMRVKLAGPVPEPDVGPLIALLDACSYIESSQVYSRIGSVAIVYVATDENRSLVLERLASIGRLDVERARESRLCLSVVRPGNLLLDIAWLVGTYLARR